MKAVVCTLIGVVGYWLITERIYYLSGMSDETVFQFLTKDKKEDE